MKKDLLSNRYLKKNLNSANLKQDLMQWIEWSKSFGVELSPEQIERLRREEKFEKSAIWSAETQRLINRGLKVNKRIKSIVPLLSKAIKTIDLNKSEHKTRILGSPWIRLPNVGNFKITLKGPDLLCKYFGIQRNIPPILQINPYQNKAMNRFIEHQIRRLAKFRDMDTQKGNQVYWHIARCLMRRSNIWRVLAIQHVLPQWHRKKPLWYVIKMNRMVSKLINENQSEMDFQRVYIPKPGKDKYRPLGVPSVPWRIYLHMYNNFLTFYLQPKLHENQHAFLPGRGTLTAWKQIFKEKLYNKKYIVSWDFKKFFDRIHSNRITEELLKKGVPKQDAYFLENINRSEVKFCLVEKGIMDESAAEEMAESHRIHKTGMWKPTDKIFNTVREMISDPRRIGNWQPPLEFSPEAGTYEETFGLMTRGLANWFILNTEMTMNNCLDIFEYVQLQWALLDSIRPTKIETDFNGVAQGAPTSPILANLIMDLWIRMRMAAGNIIVAYADDSVEFSDRPIQFHNAIINPPENTGIEINYDKSTVDKRNGVWKGFLKFLGLKFDGKTFEASTHKGSKLILNKEIMRLLNLEQIRIEQGMEFGAMSDVLKFIEKAELTQDDYWQKGNWSSIFKSKLIGFAQSRLYQGTWNLENLEQDFNYTFVHNSWASRYRGEEELSIFNSSSYACHSLANIFRWNSKTKTRVGKTGGLPKNVIFTFLHKPVKRNK